MVTSLRPPLQLGLPSSRLCSVDYLSVAGTHPAVFTFTSTRRPPRSPLGRSVGRIDVASRKHALRPGNTTAACIGGRATPLIAVRAAGRGALYWRALLPVRLALPPPYIGGRYCPCGFVPPALDWRFGLILAGGAPVRMRGLAIGACIDGEPPGAGWAVPVPSRRALFGLGFPLPCIGGDRRPCGFACPWPILASAPVRAVGGPVVCLAGLGSSSGGRMGGFVSVRWCLRVWLLVGVCVCVWPFAFAVRSAPVLACCGCASLRMRACAGGQDRAHRREGGDIPRYCPPYRPPVYSVGVPSICSRFILGWPFGNIVRPVVRPGAASGLCHGPTRDKARIYISPPTPSGHLSYIDVICKQGSFFFQQMSAPRIWRSPRPRAGAQSTAIYPPAFAL